MPYRPRRGPRPADLTVLRTARPFCCPTCLADVREAACSHVYLPLCDDCAGAHQAAVQAARRARCPLPPPPDRCPHGRVPHMGLANLPAMQPGEYGQAQGYQNRPVHGQAWWLFSVAPRPRPEPADALVDAPLS
jgi:hypothetical protein